MQAPLDVLVHTTYEAIKREILSNQLRPGTKLVHRVLAENLGVSRTPVRESLERLLQEGYVRREIHRGYFVAEMDLQEVSDLYETREALEIHALQKLTSQALPPGCLAPLKAINARYRALCLESLSRERLMVDREFHLALAALTGNAYLCRALETIFDRLILKRRVEGFHDTRGLAPYEDHRQLLLALGKGQTAEAQTLLRQHIRSACTRLTHYLQAQRQVDMRPMA